MSDQCGISRNREQLSDAIRRIPQMREAFWNEVGVPGEGAELNQSLEHAGRLSDFYEFAELMCQDALNRDESCGCHFREEHQTAEGEALRNDEQFANVSVWEYQGEDKPAQLHSEPLSFDAIPLAQRNYKT